MKPMPSLLALVTLLAFLVACQPGDSEPETAAGPEILEYDGTLEDVLTAHYEALGGAENVMAITSLRMTGKMSGTTATDAPITVEKKRPGMYRRDTVIEGLSSNLIDAFDGETVWKVDPVRDPDSTVQKVEGAEEVQRLKRLGEIEGPLVDPETKGYSIELVAKEKLDGQELFHLRVSDEQQVIGDYYLDASTYLLARSRTRPFLGGRLYEAWSTHSDYREVEGIQWSHMEVTRLPELDFQQTFAWESIELNPEVEDSRFAMP